MWVATGVGPLGPVGRPAVGTATAGLGALLPGPTPTRCDCPSVRAGPRVRGRCLGFRGVGQGYVWYFRIPHLQREFPHGRPPPGGRHLCFWGGDAFVFLLVSILCSIHIGDRDGCVRSHASTHDIARQASKREFVALMAPPPSPRSAAALLGPPPPVSPRPPLPPSPPPPPFEPASMLKPP